jgi:hypothetical protein
VSRFDFEGDRNSGHAPGIRETDENAVICAELEVHGKIAFYGYTMTKVTGIGDAILAWL